MYYLLEIENIASLIVPVCDKMDVDLRKWSSLEAFQNGP